jgi:hypothetical protein
MDNSFFILSKQDIEISRFHICTWDIEDDNSFIEFGIEFNFPRGDKVIDFKLVVPFVKDNNLTPVTCLLPNLISDTENRKFIFNDNIKEFSYLDSSKKSGGIITFETRNKLTLLPIVPELEDQVVTFSIKEPKTKENSIYTRFLIKTNYKTLSRIKKDIAKKSYIFDFKLNEKRNLPDNVYKIVKDDYHICTVKSCFCLHVIPNSYNISFIDQAKLKNIRELEVPPFKKYLSDELKNMKEGKYMILFCKENDSDAYSFFTIVNKERIGTQQIILAIGANILCSLLFGFGTLRATNKDNSYIWRGLPIEFWAAIIILIVLMIFVCYPARKKLLKIWDLTVDVLSKIYL